MSFVVVDREDLPRERNTYEFQGFKFLDTEISLIWVDMPPGDGVRLHQHPYKEIFVIQEGIGTYTVGSECQEAHAGQIIIVPSDTPHKFANYGNGPLKQMDIHLNNQFITIWLEN